METYKSLTASLKEDAKRSGNVELSVYEYVEEYAINGNDLQELFNTFTSSLIFDILDDAIYHRGEVERAKMAYRIANNAKTTLKKRMRIK